MAVSSRVAMAGRASLRRIARSPVMQVSCLVLGDVLPKKDVL